MPRTGYGRPLLAAAALFVTPAAPAVTGDKFEYDAAQVGYYSINPMALAPESNLITGDYQISYVNGSIGTSSPDAPCFSTGINLPQGALLASAQVWYTSNASSDPVFTVYRNNLATGASDQLIAEVVNDDSNLRANTTLTVDGPLRQVKNGVYSYGFGACIGSGTFFHGARIRYTYSNAGD